jgi:cell division protein ZapA
MTEEKLSIRVNVADRFYPLKIDREDEEKIRTAAKMINEKILLYKKKYSDKDTQDFLAMAALQFVTKTIEQDSKADISPIIDEIKSINSELDDYIKAEELQ